MDQSSETWLPVVDYEGLYEVSDHGNVRACEKIDQQGHLRHPRPVTPQPASREHLIVCLWRSGRRRTKSVHRLVLEAHVGPCPEGMECCHANGNPRDNRVTNLRWDTRSANQHDTVRHGRHFEASKTACKNGHAFTAENTIWRRAGGRKCRACARESYRRYHQKQKERC